MNVLRVLVGLNIAVLMLMSDILTVFVPNFGTY